MKILIAGDFAITQKYDVDKVELSVIDLFKSADLRILNLEAPVTNNLTKIIKTGPHLKANSESTQQVLKTLEVDIVTLANNHIKDFESQGVVDTIEFCNRIDIQTVGAGSDLFEASKTLYIDTNEGKLAIVNFAENEWASATENTAGSNPMDIIENVRQIQEARKHADYVFVIIHGGHEYYHFPSPRMQKQYRYYAEEGADLIASHHTHCIGGYEIYKGVPIFYSLGNFLFTLNSRNQEWYTGLVLEVEIIDGNLTHKLHPVRQEKETYNLSLLRDFEKVEILKRIECINEIIEDSAKLKTSWEQYVNLQQRAYLSYWSPLTFINNRYLKAALRKICINRIKNKKAMAIQLNLMRCESHSDMSQAVLTHFIKQL